MCTLWLGSWMAPTVTFAEATDEQSQSWHRSYTHALLQAREENRPVLISFGAAWCGWCKRMEQDVFRDADIAPELRSFIRVKVDIDEDVKTAGAYGVRSVPRTVIINIHQQVIMDQTGYIPKKVMGPALDRLKGQIGMWDPSLSYIPDVAIPEELEAIHAFQVGEKAYAPKELIGFLSSTDPDVRQAAFDVLKKKGKAAWPDLVEAMKSTYLGTRITAFMMLQKQVECPHAYDPWAAEAERLAAAHLWMKWIQEQ